MTSAIDLVGTWRAAVADEGLRRDYSDPAFDDCGWASIEVPGHWRSTFEFERNDGSVLFRRTFDHADAAPSAHPAGDRSWLELDGIFYTSDVWLDGTYLGDTEGYFFRHQFEVTEQLGARSEHVLALEVACAPQRDRTRKRNLTGVFQHWDLLDQRWNPGGIWRPVRVVRSGPVRICHARALCRDAEERTATVFVRAVLDTDDARTVELRTTVTDPDGREVVEVERDQPLAAGENRLEWTVTVPDPLLWWPWSLGDQPLYEIDVEVIVDGTVSDRHHARTGMRRVELREWIFSINGERMFLKGTNQGPSRMALAEASPALLAGDIALARQAGLDLVRVHAHISRPELYDAADEQGVVLWQDLPLQWGYARSVRRQARRQAREAVDLLAHHPSVVIWCGHNEPMAIDAEPATMADPVKRARLIARAFIAQTLPTWNRSVLDHSIAAVLQKADGSRPVVPHSGVFPHLPQLEGTDSHLYLGWYTGDERSLPTLLRVWPRLARFVGEFGAQAVPNDAAFLEPARWPDLDWNRASEVHALQKPFFDRYVPPANFATFAEWAEATQRYQATLIRHHVEALRLLKYRPCGGFAQFCFADGYPSVTWSVLGHDRSPKLGFEALARACAPVLVVADRLPDHVHPGERLTLAIHAINDRRIDFSDIVATVHLSWRQGGEIRSLAWSFGGDLPADSCVRIGVVDTVVPPSDDELHLDLHLDHAGDPIGPDAEGIVATNSYVTTVLTGPHAH